MRYSHMSCAGYRRDGRVHMRAAVTLVVVGVCGGGRGDPIIVLRVHRTQRADVFVSFLGRRARSPAQSVSRAVCSHHYTLTDLVTGSGPASGMTRLFA